MSLYVELSRLKDNKYYDTARHEYAVPIAVADWNAVEVAPEVVHKPTKAEFKRMAAQLGYEPVKHGHWTCDYVEKVELSYGVCGYIPHLKCSVCGMVSESYMRYDPPNMPEDMDGWRRCPYCGAKMEEEAE